MQANEEEKKSEEEVLLEYQEDASIDDENSVERDLLLLRARQDRIRDFLAVEEDSSESSDSHTVTEVAKQPLVKKQISSSSRWVRCLVDLPLILIMTSWLLCSGCLALYHQIYEPLFDRAQRTDTDLLHEYTYYERHCNQYDISTHTASDLLLPERDGVSHMLQHGAAVIPQVLTKHTVEELRAYIMHRNAAVTDREAYPVSQGESRVSYGIDATEHPAVTQALKEVAEHPLLRPLLQELLGDIDPAVAEITAITSWAGAVSQVWHPDTKSDGNALKFARTYSHSYSLFLPLQNVTERMGATDLCPGTHYCANDLDAVCEANKLGLHLAGPQGQYFPAGHGALINQHVWHRGSAHTDPEAPHRVVFIVSFLARPRVHANDARQLSRGTYFHQKWNMWGHTLQDLQDASSMRWPFSVLRALSLWKPRTRHWGYDLVTAVYMRFSNGQLEDEDLPLRFLPKLKDLGFPKFLQGRLLSYRASQKQRWQLFLRETLEKTRDFLTRVNLWTHGVYVGCSFLVALIRWQPRMIPGTVFRWIQTNAILALIGTGVYMRILQSRWGQDVTSGQYLMRPFPAVTLQHQSEKELSMRMPTTLPQRTDVLIGTRYDAAFLGSYDQWLDFHPGNMRLIQWAKQNAEFYKSNHDSALWSLFEESHLKDLEKGRFLLQDYRTGDWRVMSESQKRKRIRHELQERAFGILRELQKSIRWLMADLRFGFECRRSSRMCTVSQENLRRWEDALFEPTAVHVKTRSNNTQLTLPSLSRVHTFLRPINGRRTSRKKSSISPQPFHDETFKVGDLVWCTQDGTSWYPGTVLAEQPYGHFTIAYNDGTVDYEVLPSRLRPQEPVTQGDRVLGCYSDEFHDCYPGVIERVWPSGGAMIVFEDGDVEWHMTPDRYYKEPFAYAWEYYA
ncbi:hypothetical protein FisN_32Hh007 [Fistulifera solaris]|uniref:PWWP domain-containing protein n=1 Tax=Fistulifera solaris TaxID=1519565 RepID=A0A1Z5J6A1_FISSO|nr:hypothetical protein FisN_32Hh007 [Fistulifera solaris]|eukprot:GAX09311.1 hypothetical protein FisN_32Hh007 [Fistulifera solaris]